MAENLRTRQVTYIARFWISLSPTTTSQKKYRFGFAFLSEGCFPYHCFLNQNFKHYASFL